MFRHNSVNSFEIINAAHVQILLMEYVFVVQVYLG